MNSRDLTNSAGHKYGVMCVLKDDELEMLFIGAAYYPSHLLEKGVAPPMEKLRDIAHNRALNSKELYLEKGRASGSMQWAINLKVCPMDINEVFEKARLMPIGFKYSLVI